VASVAVVVVLVGLATANSGGSKGASITTSSAGARRTTTSAAAQGGAYERTALARQNPKTRRFSDLCDLSDAGAATLLRMYGSVLVAGGGAVVPPTCRFASAAEVEAFTQRAPTKAQKIGGISVHLQVPAMDQLVAAVAEARTAGHRISPRGADAAARDFAQTADLWRSRLDPALAHWRQAGRITRERVTAIQAEAADAQLREVLALEATGLWFGKDQHGPILSSVAAPGSSQHLSLLAFDVADYDDPTVVATLGRHGWFRTIVGDLPHFTFLGAAEGDLPSLGLRKETVSGRAYWVPAL
jgi:hypothetical protein